MIMLLQLSQYFPFAPFYSLRQPPPQLFMSMGHVNKFFGCSISYTCTLHPHGYSVTTYLYFLISSHLRPFSLSPFPSGIHQNTLHVHDSVSVLLVCLVCSLDSVVDRYIYCHFILL